MTWSSTSRTKESSPSLDPRYPLLTTAQMRSKRQSTISSPSYRWICSFNFRRWLTYTFYSRHLCRQFLRSQWHVTSPPFCLGWFQLYSSPCSRIYSRTSREGLRIRLRTTRPFRGLTRSLMGSKTTLGKILRLDRWSRSTRTRGFPQIWFYWRVQTPQASLMSRQWALTERPTWSTSPQSWTCRTPSCHQVTHQPSTALSIATSQMTSCTTSRGACQCKWNRVSTSTPIR